MATTIQEFDPVRITNPGIKFDGETTSTILGCIGQIEGETEIYTVVKNCEGVQTKSKSKVRKMTLKLNAHVKVEPYRKLFGISSDNLKAGVYSYGKNSDVKAFTLTADVIDDFEEVTKLIAFPNCSSNTGLTLKIENGADEVAELELEFDAMIDVNGNCYYEAFEDEITDETLKDTWRTNFTPDLVKIATP